jgi:hypothetical protein
LYCKGYDGGKLDGGTEQIRTAQQWLNSRDIGRYLSTAPHSTLDKNLHEGELALMARCGLAAFPIYQTCGGEAFTAPTGPGSPTHSTTR